MSGIYVHIPFCKQACFYCDFHFSTSTKSKSEVLNAIKQEIESRAHELKSAVSSVYFGGGTPSFLEPDELEFLLNGIRASYQVSADAEFTIECNPDDMTANRLRSWKEMGFNRLSVGIQSFRNEHLKFMNRAHDEKEAASSLARAKSAGFSNLSLDLIYGIPNMDMHIWRDNIRRALDHEPQHISAYCLTIEPQTVFGRWAKQGKLKPEEDEVAAEQFEVLLQMLNEGGLQQYEVSNFAKDGFQSWHNSSYWKNAKYLGFGPSAHSFDGASRRWNVSNNARYVKAMASGEDYFEKEELSPEDRFNERVMTGLRTTWGVDIAQLKLETGFDLCGLFSEEIVVVMKQGLGGVHEGIFKLTSRGLLQADRIASDFFIIDT